MTILSTQQAVIVILTKLGLRQCFAGNGRETPCLVNNGHLIFLLIVPHPCYDSKNNAGVSGYLYAGVELYMLDMLIEVASVLACLLQLGFCFNGTN